VSIAPHWPSERAISSAFYRAGRRGKVTTTALCRIAQSAAVRAGGAGFLAERLAA
jgi:hypothetical protein